MWRITTTTRGLAFIRRSSYVILLWAFQYYAPLNHSYFIYSRFVLDAFMVCCVVHNVFLRYPDHCFGIFEYRVSCYVRNEEEVEGRMGANDVTSSSLDQKEIKRYPVLQFTSFFAATVF